MHIGTFSSSGSSPSVFSPKLPLRSRTRTTLFSLMNPFAKKNTVASTT